MTTTALWAALAAAALATAPAHAATWPGWRGPETRGIATGALPTEWSADKNVLWKTALPGRGLSSPIVWGSRIFVTTAVEGDPVPGGSRRARHAYWQLRTSSSWSS